MSELLTVNTDMEFADFGAFNSSTNKSGNTRPSMPMKKGSTESSNITLSTVSTAPGSSMHLSVDSSTFNDAITVSSVGERSSERSAEEKSKKSKKKKAKKSSSSSSSRCSSSSSKGSKEKSDKEKSNKEKSSSRKKRASKSGSSQEDHDAIIDSMMSPEQDQRPSLAGQADDPFAGFEPNPDPATLNPFHDSFMPAKCEFGDFSDDVTENWGETADDYHARFNGGYERRGSGLGSVNNSIKSGSTDGDETSSPSIDLSQMEDMPRSQLDGGSDMNDSFSVYSDVTGLTGMFDSQNLSDDEEQAAQEPDVAPLAYPKQAGRPQASKLAATDKKSRRSHKQKLSVTFSTVESRYYERILGDNPSVMTGPPLGIGWRFRAFKPMDLNKYEQKRGPTRPSAMLVVPKDDRERRLTAVGVTKKQMVAAVRENVKMRNRRRQTVQNLTVQNMEESLEGASNTLKGLFGLKKKQDAAQYRRSSHFTS